MQPREVLRHSPGVDLVEMAEPEWCCGMGGSFNLLHYDLSSAIGERKLGNIRDSGASMVVTSCPGLHEPGSATACPAPAAESRVKHVIELYADGLANADKSQS